MVDIALALLISYIHTLDAADESGRAADGLEGAYGRVDAAGNAALRALEKLLIGAHGWRSQKNGEGKPGAIAPDAPDAPDCESVADPAPGRRRPTPGARLAPAMFDRTRSYARAILERDPAARSVWDVLFSYPGFHALMLHRVAHWPTQIGRASCRERV